MLPFQSKIHQNRWRLGLRLRPRCERCLGVAQDGVARINNNCVITNRLLDACSINVSELLLRFKTLKNLYKF